eukprot:TRINITY_DN9451_c0_g1_i1.p1 TRINITY_DN9451_c0_g1~~TRINITY_DN9451_c0_g1_i1.p1  ORF type:complete len:208 (-),score=20.95 TRINITY_DN9451_c0_g1_i1:954-1577(-)
MLSICNVVFGLHFHQFTSRNHWFVRIENGRTQKTWNLICLGNDCHLFTPNKYLTCYGYSFKPAMKASCLTNQGYANLPFYVSGNAASSPVSEAWFYIYLPQRQIDFCFARYFFYVLKGPFDFSLFEISAWEMYIDASGWKGCIGMLQQNPFETHDSSSAHNTHAGGWEGCIGMLQQNPFETNDSISAHNTHAGGWKGCIRILWTGSI